MSVIQETGTVTVIRETKAGVRVRHERSEACHGCKACRAGDGKEFLLWVEADGLKLGDRVTIEVPVPSVWRAMAMVFGIPLAALVGGVLAGSEWTGFQREMGLGPESGAVALGIALGAVALGAALVVERRFAAGHRPRVIEVDSSV